VARTISRSPGDIDHDALNPPSASQLGSARTIATVALRVMNAVWRNNNLYTCHTIRPPVGSPEVNEATAHWYRLGTLNLAALGVADQGNVSAEDLGVGTHTFMPAVMVDVCDNMAVGFAASGPAYTREPTTRRARRPIRRGRSVAASRWRSAPTFTFVPSARA
jgi:hypothetical protein